MGIEQTKSHVTMVHNSIEKPNVFSDKFDNIRDFIGQKMGVIMNHKLDTLLAAGVLASTIAISTNSKDNDTVNQQLIDTQSTSYVQYDSNRSIESKDDLLGYVDQYGNIVYNEENIRKQAETYYLDYDLFREAIVKNESVLHELESYISESEYSQYQYNYSYRQLAEALGELKVVEFLRDQQYTDEATKVASQRIVNELLRSKQGDKSLEANDKYDLILEAAKRSYEYIHGVNFTQEAMGNITRNIDSGEYGVDFLETYAQDLRDYIHYDVGFDMYKYEDYLASIRQNDMIVQNNTINQRGNYE